MRGCAPADKAELRVPLEVRRVDTDLGMVQQVPRKHAFALLALANPRRFRLRGVGGAGADESRLRLRLYRGALPRSAYSQLHSQVLFVAVMM